MASFSVAMLILLGPHVFLPSCRLHRVVGFVMQFWLNAKATRLQLPLPPSQLLSLSLSLPVPFSQGLVLVLIVFFVFLPALSTAHFELRGNSDAE